MAIRLPQGISIFSWNCNGILGRQQEFINSITSGNFDVIALQETHLSPNKTFRIPNFHTYRRDRTSDNHGGVLIAVKSSLKHKALPTTALSTLESIGIRLSTPTGDLEIFSVYQPASKPLILDEVRLLFSSDKRIIAVGDWNAKHKDWGFRRGNLRGEQLKRLAAELQANVEEPLAATHIDPRGNSDSLDFA
jgi:exonuclease III